jgi:AAA family ATP:ADP antiporter
MGEVRSERFLPELLPLLAARDVRGAARGALRAYGDRGLRFLDEALADHDLPHEIRRNLPRTISLFPAADAAGVLLRHLLAEPEGMVLFKILRGLGRIATDHPEVALDGTILQQATEQTVVAAVRLLDWRLTLLRGAVRDPRRATPGHELLAALLRDKEVHAVERIFRLLGLQFRDEDFRDIHRGLRNTNPKVRASSRELLENLLASPLREAILALVDDAPDEERLGQSRPFVRGTTPAYDELLARLLDEPSESLRSIAAHHVGELRLVALRPQLESLDRSETGFFVTRVVQRALRQLSEGSLAHA